MDFNEILDIAIPIVYVIVGIALIWFVIELVLVIRKVRRTVGDLEDKINPTLEHVESITSDIQPAIAKVDPLVERASLTVDAANLEMMRVDQILEDVGQVTGSITGAMDTVGAVTHAPLNLVTSATEKIREVFKPRSASEESVKLGQAEEADDQEDSKTNPVDELVDTAADVAVDAVSGVLTNRGAHASQASDENPSDEGQQDALFEQDENNTDDSDDA